MNLELKRTPGIYLVGFMGSGKSTIGQLLSETLGWPFADLDDDIISEAGKSIAELFDEDGEDSFRSVEATVLDRRIASVKLGRPIVLALGGGTFAQPANRAKLKGNGISIWLDVPFDIVQRRVAGFEHRPLARDPEKFRTLFDARLPLYAEADARIPITSDDPGQAVQSILNQGWFHKVGSK